MNKVLKELKLLFGLFLPLLVRTHFNQIFRKRWNLFPDKWKQAVKKYPKEIGLVYKDKEYTYQEMDDLANIVAQNLYKMGYKCGDNIGLKCTNDPETVWAFLGLVKLGITVTVVKPTSYDQVLIDYLNSCSAKILICKENEIDKLQQVTKADIKLLSIDELLESKELVSEKITSGVCLKNLDVMDVLSYLPTSGTTGPQKGTIILQLKSLIYLKLVLFIGKMKKGDIIYCCNTLSHGMGLYTSLIAAWLVGGKTILVDGFEPKKCIEDCYKYKVTILPYVGQMARLLMSTEPQDIDQKLSIRVAFGHELRADIWNAFKERFRVPYIGEFYGSTGGNSFVLNSFGKKGAVGFSGPLLSIFLPTPLIKVDENYELVRDKNGFCVMAKIGEQGEMLGVIKPKDLIKSYEGYSDKIKTEESTIKDVFKKGDLWYRSKDILVQNKDGFYYFIDRVGDNFRWNGENVSTHDVEEVVWSILKLHGHISHKCNVYGVNVNADDGKLCMITMQLNQELDLVALYEYLELKLSQNANPFLLRITPYMNETLSMKKQKIKMQNEGFDPEFIQDQMYFRDQKSRAYVPIDTQSYNKIQKGMNLP